MRVTRLVPLSLLAIVVILAAAAWAVPGFMNWSRYRGTLASLASSTLGLPVHIDGPVSLVLLPEPVLTASSIDVLPVHRDIALSIQEMRLRVAPLALLSGHIDARELVLHGADLRLPWPLPVGVVSARPPSWLTALSARVEDGHVQLGQLTLSHVDAALRTADSGTLVADGTATVFGQIWHFTARISRPGGDGMAGFELALAGQGGVAKTGASFSGQVAADGALAGRVAVWGPDLGLLLPAPSVPFKAEGRLAASGGLAAADDLSIELGNQPARGAVALRVAPAPRLDVALTANRLDLDPWLHMLLQPASFRLGLPFGLDLSAEASVVAGGTLRRVRGAFDLTQAGIRVREVSAILPGDAVLRLDGRVDRPRDGAGGAAPSFAGRARLNAPALRDTLHWLQAASALADLPAGLLDAAELTADVNAAPGQIALSNLAGTLDGEAVSGSLSLRLGGARPSMGAGLLFEHLSLDPFLPATLPAMTDIPRWLAGFDGDLRVQAKTAVLRGLAIDDLALDASAEAGRLTVRQWEGVAQGMRITASGVLSEAGRLNQGHLDLSSNAIEALMAALPASWVIPWGNQKPPMLQGPFSLQVTADGPPTALALHLTAALADARLEATPTLDVPAHFWAGAVTLQHPGAARFLLGAGLPALLGLSDPSAWIGDGSLSLVAELACGPQRLVAEHFDLTAGGLRAGGQFTLDRTPVPHLVAQISADTWPLPLPHPHAPDPWPLALLQGWSAAVHIDAKHVLVGQVPVIEDAAASINLADGKLVLDPVTGRLAAGSLTASLSLDTGQEPPALSAKIAVVGARIDGRATDLPIDLTAGTVGATADLTASGHSPAALLATLAGPVQVSVHGGTLTGFDLGRIHAIVSAAAEAPRETIDAAVLAALSTGTTAFDTLDLPMQASGGTLSLDLGRLAQPDQTASVAGSIDLSSGTMDLQMRLRPSAPAPPEIGLRLSGPFAQPRRVPEMAGLARWLADRPP